MEQSIAAKRREKMNKQQNESGTELTERTEPSNNRLSSFIGFLLPKDVFTPLFWKSFISVFLVCVLLYVLEFLRFSTFDSEFSYKHLAVVLVSLSEWSFCVSLACSLYGFCNAPHLSRVALRKSGKKVCFRGLRESVMPS